MTDETGDPGRPRRRSVGRPRVLTRAKVIETAALMPAGQPVAPDELVQVLGIESTLEPELRLTEAFYAALVARGFALEEAVDIH